MGKKHKSSLSKQFILKLMHISFNRMHIGIEYDYTVFI